MYSIILIYIGDENRKTSQNVGLLYVSSQPCDLQVCGAVRVGKFHKPNQHQDLGSMVRESSGYLPHLFRV